MRKMRFFPAIFILVLLSTGCNFFNTNKNMPEKEITDHDITFIHTVFFWMNDTVTDAERAEFEKGLKKLGTVPEIRKYFYGRPAGTVRDVVDNSWDYSWIVHFSSAEDQNTYQTHPIHLEFVEKYQHLWKEVKVYDTSLKKLKDN